MTHITWSIEKDDRCPKCSGKTVLIVAPVYWLTSDREEEIEVNDEVIGHYCKTCDTLVSLSLNTEV